MALVCRLLDGTCRAPHMPRSSSILRYASASRRGTSSSNEQISSTTEKKFSKLIYERDVDKLGFGRIRSKGDKALFGHTTMNIKKKLGVPNGRSLADFLPTITIKAKDFATEITNFNVKKDDLVGEIRITDEHVKNNTEVRSLLVKSDIMPEELPPAEDAKKLERKVKSDSKKLLKGSKLLHLE